MCFLAGKKSLCFLFTLENWIIIGFTSANLVFYFTKNKILLSLKTWHSTMDTVTWPSTPYRYQYVHWNKHMQLKIWPCNQVHILKSFRLDWIWHPSYYMSNLNFFKAICSTMISYMIKMTLRKLIQYELHSPLATHL